MKLKNKLLFLLVFFAFSGLCASTVTETLGATSTVNPFSARMFAGGAEATYFNPALLPKTKRSFTLNFFYSYRNLDITLFDRPDSLNIIGSVTENSGIYGADQVNNEKYETNLPYKTRPTADLDERGNDSSKEGNLYGAVGLVLPIWKDYIALGLYGMLPIGSMMKEQSFFADEREANFSNSLHYELYDDRMTSFNISLALAGGYKWVYAGVGLNITAEANVQAPIFTPDAGKNENKIGTFAEIKPKLVPHFGLIIRPWGPIQLGFTAHLPAKTDIDVDTKITFWYIDRDKEAEINRNRVHVAYAFRPLALSPSIAIVDYKFKNDLELSVGFTAIWRQWSKYKNRYNESPEYNVYWDSSIVEKDENGNIAKVGGWASEYVDKYKWKDAWEFTLGTNFKYHAIKTGLDLGYFMSPVPKQDGRTNYVDNDRLSIAAGFSYTWDLPENMQLELGGNFQAHIMLERTTKKEEGEANSVGKDGKTVDEFPDSVCDGFGDCPADTPIAESEGFQTNNPGYPGYKSSGQIFTGGLWLTLYF